MRKLPWFILLPLLVSCASDVRVEEGYVDGNGVYHDCGIGKGLERCDQSEEVVETNEVLEAEAKSMRTETPEELESRLGI
ncbi:MAG: hypothetical protein QNK32_06565 [Porticoccus sp.]|nr:hypothetical protein [Porticoccus sp.]